MTASTSTRHTSTLGRAALGFADAGEIDRFVDTLGRFERGEIEADAWRAFRLVAGTYGQRQLGDLSMLRAKIPQGILSAAQLEALADVADRYSRGFAHLTTRQNLQFHFMKLAEVGAAMQRLAEAGITTREACGNAVRNVTMSPTAGVSLDEVFDPAPYAEALTRYLLRHPLSGVLPRKFKIAFSSGGADDAFALINDLGWHPRIERRDGRDVRGFRLTIGGGTALWCQSGRELFEFLPAAEMLGVTLAILQVYEARGDRVHRHKNRIRYMIKAMGWDAFRAAFDEQWARVRAEGAPPLPFDPDAPHEPAPHVDPPAPSADAAQYLAFVAHDVLRGPGLTPRRVPLPLKENGERFSRTNVRPQRQAGYSIVTATIPLGDVTSGQLRAIARISQDFGEGAVRTTPAQNLIFRWVRTERVPGLFQALRAIGLASPDADSVADATSCPGAESCKLAVTQSRGLARDIGDTFGDEPAFVDRAEGLIVKISGCPNGCGLHHIGGLGFQGGLRKVDGRAAPYYHVYAGGDPSGTVARFGRVIGKLPARRVTAGIRVLVSLYEAKRGPGESITAYLSRAPVAELRAAIAPLEAAPPGPEDFTDLADTEPFRPETSEGECVA